MDHAILVGFQAMPLHEGIEQSHGVAHATPEIGPYAMHHLLEVTDQGQHGECGFYDHAIVPFPALTDAQVLRMPIFLLEASIGEDHGLTGHLLYYCLERGAIVDIGGVAIPVHDQTLMILQQTQLAAHDPAPVGFALAANLPGTAALPAGMNQLDTLCIDDAQQARGSHEAIHPFPMRIEQTKQSRARWQMGEQRAIVACQPAIEGAVAHALQSKQQSQRHYLAGIQFGLRMFLGIWHLIIYPAKQFYDKILCSHENLPNVCLAFHLLH